MTDARTKCIELEAKVLEFSGLELNKELFVYDVTINLNGKNRLIHTYRCGSQNKDTLVLLHGYAGSSVLYYKMLKTLSQKFKVYCVDIVGMALSSKEEFTCTTTEETIDFLTGFVEEWRKANNIDTFTIAGHSFGAYVSTQYTLKYPERVKKLNMLSPVGFTDPLNDDPEDQNDNNMGWFKKTLLGWVRGYAKKQIDNQVTPISYIKDHSWIGNWAVKNYVYKRFGLKEKEADVVYEFLWAMLNLPEGSEKAIHYILKPPRMSAVVPLEESIKDIKIPIDCYYGEKDYMNTNGARRVHQKKIKDDFVIKILAGAAHQVTVQNPQDLADQIVVSALV